MTRSPDYSATPIIQVISYLRRRVPEQFGSDKVEGTAVYGANDTKIGSIERVMIDKMTGKVSYAVLSFGGLLGIGVGAGVSVFHGGLFAELFRLL